MSDGLRVFDENGNVTLDVSDRLTRVLWYGFIWGKDSDGYFTFDGEYEPFHIPEFDSNRGYIMTTQENEYPPPEPDWDNSNKLLRFKEEWVGDNGRTYVIVMMYE